MRPCRRAASAVLALAALSACAGDGDPLHDADLSARSVTTVAGDDAIATDVSQDAGADDVAGGGAGGGGGRIRGLRLAPFDDCSGFLQHVKQEATDRVGPYGLDGSGYPWATLETSVEMTMDATMEAPAATMAAAEDSTASFEQAATSSPATATDGDDSGEREVVGTNTQESGVDEPDIIKTDGERIVTISENMLTVVDITGDQPVVTGTLGLGESWGHQMFLQGDHAIVVTNSGGWAMPVDFAGADVDGIAMAAPVGTVPPTAPPTTAPVDAEASFADGSTVPPTELTDSVMPAVQTMPGAVVIDVDLSQPDALRVDSTLRVEGQYLSARVIDGRMLLAVSTGPQWMPWLYPQSPAGEERAVEANRALVDDSQLSDWVPQYELVVGDTTTGGDLLACDRVHHPADFSGFDMISVLGIDLTAGLATGFDPASATGVLAGGQTVYASLDRLYVATTKWVGTDAIGDSGELVAWAEDYETDLHAFSITAGRPVAYVASGSVDGTLLNQFSMDEHLGYLRVFATDGTPWNQTDLSETRLVVLQEQADRLTAVGEVGGLGRGEALYAARMIGDRGFAVTFRQTDPFYVLDLTDPTAPQVTGELKIPGFSTYLHPVGDHRVLGVGRDATDDGIVRGLKLSLFDVSDPSAPSEIAVWTLEGANSAVEYDHHAFQMIGSTAILPVQSWADGFNGAILFEIGDTISELGRISHTLPTAEPTTECRPITTDDLAEDSQLSWMTFDPNLLVQLCGVGAASGYGDWYCDVVAIDEIGAWFGSQEIANEVAALGGESGGRLEMCYRNDMGSLDAIQRSVIVDGTLWTMSTARLEGHDLATLAPIGGVSLR